MKILTIEMKDSSPRKHDDSGATRCSAGRLAPHKFIILNTQFMIFDAKFLILNTRFIVVHTKFIILNRSAPQPAPLR